MASKETGVSQNTKADPRKNPISRWFYTRRIKKKKQRYFKAKIKPEKYEAFLQEIDKALADLLKDYPDSTLFLDKVGKETTRWLNDMPEMNMASFKVGFCYGLYSLTKVKSEKENKKEGYVV